MSLKSDIVIAIFCGGAGGAMTCVNPARAPELVQRAEQFADYLIEHHAERALDIAKMLSYGATTFLRTSRTDFAAWVSVPMLVISNMTCYESPAKVDEKPAESNGKTQPMNKVAEPPKSKSKKPREAAPVQAAAAAATAETTQGSKEDLPPEIAVRQLGLPDEIVELLIDNGIGTSKLALDYDRTRAKGLGKFLSEEHRKMVLREIAAKTNVEVVV